MGPLYTKFCFFFPFPVCQTSEKVPFLQVLASYVQNASNEAY